MQECRLSLQLLIEIRISKFWGSVKGDLYDFQLASLARWHVRSSCTPRDEFERIGISWDLKSRMEERYHPSSYPFILHSLLYQLGLPVGTSMVLLSDAWGCDFYCHIHSHRFWCYWSIFAKTKEHQPTSTLQVFRMTIDFFKEEISSIWKWGWKSTTINKLNGLWDLS